MILAPLKPEPLSADSSFQKSVPILETARLRLRPLHSGDTPWLEELLLDQEVRRFTLLPVRGRLRAWLEAPSHVWAPQRWAIDQWHSGPCGWISFGHLEEIDTITVGFELRQQFWNRGIMTEALDRLAEYHFSQQPHEPLSAIVFEQNHASRRVFEKAGFLETGFGDCQGRRSAFLNLSPAQYARHRELRCA